MIEFIYELLGSIVLGLVVVAAAIGGILLIASGTRSK